MNIREYIYIFAKKRTFSRIQISVFDEIVFFEMVRRVANAFGFDDVTVQLCAEHAVAVA